MTPLRKSTETDVVVLLQGYHDASGVKNVWGPFRDDFAAKDAIPALEEIGQTGNWRVMTLRGAVIWEVEQ